MTKTALITGATDGIGKQLALRLAKKEYSVQVLGLGKEKGQALLDELFKIYPSGKHELFIVDLSSTGTVNRFLDKYLMQHDTLDLLILNANATTFKKVTTNTEGIDTAFMIGYLSRYMFSVRLDEILKKSKTGQIIHIGGATMVSPVKWNKLTRPDYSVLKSTAMGFMANNLLVHFSNRLRITIIPYRFIEPGIVNTNTVKSQGAVTRYLSKFFGMIEPEESAELVMQSIFNEIIIPGQFYSKEKEREPKKSVRKSEEEFYKLLEYSKYFTGLSF